jgi:hypothetical protein
LVLGLVLTNADKLHPTGLIIAVHTNSTFREFTK